MSDTFNTKQNINEIKEQLFSSFEREYDALKDAIEEKLTEYENELSDKSDMLKRASREAGSFKERIQTRDVMDAILPIITDMSNDIADCDDLDEAKLIVASGMRQLNTALLRAGVTLKLHKKGQEIDLEESVNGYPRPTDNPDLNGRICRTTKIGCVIRGEEDNPILEEVEIYVYRGTEESSAEPMKENDGMGYDSDTVYDDISNADQENDENDSLDCDEEEMLSEGVDTAAEIGYDDEEYPENGEDLDTDDTNLGLDEGETLDTEDDRDKTDLGDESAEDDTQAIDIAEDEYEPEEDSDEDEKIPSEDYSGMTFIGERDEEPKPEGEENEEAAESTYDSANTFRKKDAEIYQGGRVSLTSSLEFIQSGKPIIPITLPPVLYIGAPLRIRLPMEYRNESMSCICFGTKQISSFFKLGNIDLAFVIEYRMDAGVYLLRFYDIATGETIALHELEI